MRANLTAVWPNGNRAREAVAAWMKAPGCGLSNDLVITCGEASDFLAAAERARMRYQKTRFAELGLEPPERPTLRVVVIEEATAEGAREETVAAWSAISAAGQSVMDLRRTAVVLIPPGGKVVGQFHEIIAGQPLVPILLTGTQSNGYELTWKDFQDLLGLLLSSIAFLEAPVGDERAIWTEERQAKDGEKPKLRLFASLEEEPARLVSAWAEDAAGRALRFIREAGQTEGTARPEDMARLVNEARAAATGKRNPEKFLEELFGPRGIGGWSPATLLNWGRRVLEEIQEVMERCPRKGEATDTKRVPQGGQCVCRKWLLSLRWWVKEPDSEEREIEIQPEMLRAVISRVAMIREEMRELEDVVGNQVDWFEAESRILLGELDTCAASFRQYFREASILGTSPEKIDVRLRKAIEISLKRSGTDELPVLLALTNQRRNGESVDVAKPVVVLAGRTLDNSQTLRCLVGNCDLPYEGGRYVRVESVAGLPPLVAGISEVIDPERVRL